MYAFRAVFRSAHRVSSSSSSSLSSSSSSSTRHFSGLKGKSVLQKLSTERQCLSTILHGQTIRSFHFSTDGAKKMWVFYRWTVASAFWSSCENVPSDVPEIFLQGRKDSLLVRQMQKFDMFYMLISWILLKERLICCILSQFSLFWDGIFPKFTRWWQS